MTCWSCESDYGIHWSMRHCPHCGVELRKRKKEEGGYLVPLDMTDEEGERLAELVRQHQPKGDDCRTELDRQEISTEIDEKMTRAVAKITDYFTALDELDGRKDAEFKRSLADVLAAIVAALPDTQGKVTAEVRLRGFTERYAQ